MKNIKKKGAIVCGSLLIANGLLMTVIANLNIGLLHGKLSNAEKTIAILVRTNYQVAGILRKAKNQDDIVLLKDLFE